MTLNANIFSPTLPSLSNMEERYNSRKYVNNVVSISSLFCEIFSILNWKWCVILMLQCRFDENLNYNLWLRVRQVLSLTQVARVEWDNVICFTFCWRNRHCSWHELWYIFCSYIMIAHTFIGLTLMQVVVSIRP